MLSTLVWSVLQPSNFLFLILLAAALAALLGRYRATRWLVLAAAAGFVLVTFLPLGQWLTRGIESRFPAITELPPDVAGVVALTGGIDAGIVTDPDQLALNEAAERVTTLIELGRRYPQARLIHAGTLGPNGLPVDAFREFARKQGFDPARIEIETRSSSTEDDVRMAKELAQPKPGERWILVTSAFAMPRAVGLMRKQGWAVTPFPVDYRAPPPDAIGISQVALQPNVSQRFKELDLAAKELFGLAFAWLKGSTSAFLPSA